ncbi:MAG: GNAT family N-acetyltransferase [Gaiellales bacterium]
MNAPFVHPVRRALPEDAPAVGRMLHDRNREFDEPAPAPEVLAERIRELGARRNFVVLLAGTGPDGLVVLRFRASLWTAAQECYVAELYVRPSRRRQGLGLALMREAMEVARAKGADCMDLGVAEDDAGARALYERLGFSNRGGKPDGAVNLSYEREL